MLGSSLTMLSMFKSIKEKFFKKPKEKLEITDFSPGDFVELEYVDPKSIGIVSNNTLTFTRLNSDELENRTIQGTIDNIKWNKDLQTNLVYVKTFKKIDYETVVRQYLFLDYEIKNIRKLS